MVESTAEFDDLNMPIPRHDRWDFAQRVVAALLLLMLIPVFVLIALVIKLTSRGPVLYTQTRPGYLEHTFKIYKFRTMTVGSDQDTSMGLTVPKNSSKVTAIGRFLRKVKLDELPQLWNVIKGEMALVGPRPIAQVLHERLMAEIPGFGRRYLVKPGLTNVAQVTIMDNLPAEQVVEDWKLRFEAEYHYVMRKSMSYDIVVMLLTVVFIIRKALPVGGANVEKPAATK